MIVLSCNELTGWGHGDDGFVFNWCVLTDRPQAWSLQANCKHWTSFLNLSRATTKCWARGSCPSSLSLWKQSSSVEEQRRRSKKLVVPVCLWHKSFCFIQIFWINTVHKRADLQKFGLFWFFFPDLSRHFTLESYLLSYFWQFLISGFTASRYV